MVDLLFGMETYGICMYAIAVHSALLSFAHAFFLEIFQFFLSPLSISWPPSSTMPLFDPEKATFDVFLLIWEGHKMADGGGASHKVANWLLRFCAIFLLQPIGYTAQLMKQSQRG